MKSPRFLAALAMAAVLTTGTAAHASTDFKPVSGTAANGQTPMQETSQYDDGQQPVNQITLDADGEIRVDGEFTKTVNSLPKPDKDGRYLRVTMPIQMNFQYDVDTNKMTAAVGKIKNESVYATNVNQSNETLEGQKIKMSIVDFVEETSGVATMKNIEFVETVGLNTNSGTKKVELPFELRLESGTGTITKHSIQKIQTKVPGTSANAIQPMEIAAGETVVLTFDKIKGQNLGNPELITAQASQTSHNLKLKFEYAGR